jgi:hypothetical protein
MVTLSLKCYPIIGMIMSRQKALVPTIQIRIRQDTYEELVRKGNLADTFDSVIQRLLENDKTQEIA